MKLKKTHLLLLALALLIAVEPSFASSGSGSAQGLPWESPLDMIVNSIQGPVAKSLIAGLVAITGVMLAAGEHGQGARRILGIVFGAGIALGVTSFVSTLFTASF